MEPGCLFISNTTSSNVWVGYALRFEVATQLMARDALGAHARDELGITEASMANPVQAALASAAAFAFGGLSPVPVTLAAPGGLPVAPAPL